MNDSTLKFLYFTLLASLFLYPLTSYSADFSLSLYKINSIAIPIGAAVGIVISIVNVRKAEHRPIDFLWNGLGYGIFGGMMALPVGFLFLELTKLF